MTRPVYASGFLARRKRLLLLDARKSIELAPIVAKWMAEELGKDSTWISQQIAEYSKLAGGYLLS